MKSLGQDNGVQISSKIAGQTFVELAIWPGVDPATPQVFGPQATLVRALTARASDPDIVLADWLEGQVPLGIECGMAPGMSSR